MTALNNRMSGVISDGCKVHGLDARSWGVLGKGLYLERAPRFRHALCLR